MSPCPRKEAEQLRQHHVGEDCDQHRTPQPRRTGQKARQAVAFNDLRLLNLDAVNARLSRGLDDPQQSPRTRSDQPHNRHVNQNRDSGIRRRSPEVAGRVFLPRHGKFFLEQRGILFGERLAGQSRAVRLGVVNRHDQLIAISDCSNSTLLGRLNGLWIKVLSRGQLLQRG